METGAFGGIDPGIKRDNPSTWTKGWPPMQKSGLVYISPGIVVHIDSDLRGHRILGVLPVFTKRAQDNRQNPRVYEVFANILGEKV